MVTEQGSLAGTPFADLAHTFAMSRVLSVFRKSLSIANLESHVQVGATSHKVEDVSFVDDVTVLVVDSASSIISKVEAVTVIAVNTFAGFGMDLNFSAGKSECILALAGKGKVKVNKFLYECGNATDIVINSSKTINMKSPKVYKHASTKVGANLNVEVFSRCALMVHGAGALQKKVLRNHGIEISKRLFVLFADILTKGTVQ